MGSPKCPLFFFLGYDPGFSCRGIHFDAVFDLFPIQIDLGSYEHRWLAPRAELQAGAIVEVLLFQVTAAFRA
jgi:hypothetical protein